MFLFLRLQSWFCDVVWIKKSSVTLGMFLNICSVISYGFCEQTVKDRLLYEKVIAMCLNRV